MSKKQIAKRILLSQTGISKKQFENREFTNYDWERTYETIKRFSVSHLLYKCLKVK